MMNGRVFMTGLLVFVLISLRGTLHLLKGDSFENTKVSSSSWRSREILQANGTEYSVSKSRPAHAAQASFYRLWIIRCGDVISKYNSSLICHYIKVTPDCQLTDGFLQYIYLPYCMVPWTFGFFILAFWLVYLFVILGITADDYFCPCLTVIAKTLRMSQEMAGVTLLAYGSGAPDIFSAVAAFTHASAEENDTAELGIEAILGSGVFVTTVVVFSITLCTPDGFVVAGRSFIRDILFYIAAVTWMVIALCNQQLSLLEAIGLIVMYVIYMKVAVVGSSLYQYWSRKKRAEERQLDINVDASGVAVVPSDLESATLMRDTSHNQQDEETPIITPENTLDYSTVSPIKKLLYGMLPFKRSQWQEAGLPRKIFMVYKAPIVLVLNITVPVVDYAEPDQNWNKWLNVIHCITGPVIAVMGIEVGRTTVAGHFPVWALTLSLGVLLALAVATLTSSNHPPRFHWMFAYLAFIIVAIWIYATTVEVVNLLQTFNVALRLSDAILGLTFLAWGTSIAEIISCVTVARQGYPNMAASACFGGTLLNLLLGIGIACTIVAAKQGYNVVLPHRYHQYIISSVFLLLSLVSSGIIIPLMGFKITRSYGIYLFVIYILYLTIAILSEVEHL